MKTKRRRNGKSRRRKKKQTQYFCLKNNKQQNCFRIGFCIQHDRNCKAQDLTTDPSKLYFHWLSRSGLPNDLSNQPLLVSIKCAHAMQSLDRTGLSNSTNILFFIIIIFSCIVQPILSLKEKKWRDFTHFLISGLTKQF